MGNKFNIMKKVFKHLKLVTTGIAVCLLFASCLKDGDDTIVIPLPDGKIPYSVVSEAMQDSLLSNGFDINEGIDFPKIESGVYFASPLKLKYASDGYENEEFFPLYLTFRNWKQRGRIEYEERQRDTVEGTSIRAQVIGHDSCFTMYCYQNLSEYSSNNEQLWTCKIATLISGILTKDGFRNCQYALIILDKQFSDPDYNIFPPIDSYRIYYDQDSITNKIRNL